MSLQLPPAVARGDQPKQTLALSGGHVLLVFYTTHPKSFQIIDIHLASMTFVGTDAEAGE